MTRKTLTTATASAALIMALGSSAAFAGDMTHNFASFDANVDGQVTLEEFTSVVTADASMSETAAAEKFEEIANGSDVFTEADFDAAMAWDSDAEVSEPYVVEQPNEEVLDSMTKSTTETEIEIDEDEATITEDTTTIVEPEAFEPSETDYSSEIDSGAYTNLEADTDAAVAPEAPEIDTAVGIDTDLNTDAQVYGDESGAYDTSEDLITEPDLVIDPLADPAPELDVDPLDEATTAIEGETEAVIESETEITSEIETPEAPEVETDENPLK